MSMKPRSLLFDLFGGHLRYLGGEARLQPLCEFLELFGIPPATTRVALARMRKEEWFSTRRDGRQTIYTLTEKSGQLLDDGRTQIFKETPKTWDEQWRMAIYTVPEESRDERERFRRTLTWHGFGPLAASTWVSPHSRLDQIGTALGKIEAAARLDLLTCRSRGRAHDRDMAARCWDLEGLGRDYANLIKSYSLLPSPSELEKYPGAEALRYQIEHVNAYRTFPFRDPDLPDQLLPEGWQGREAHRNFVEIFEALNGPARAYVQSVLERTN
jgi:phenylacetic acid degradation operon negative regulatory protein